MVVAGSNHSERNWELSQPRSILQGVTAALRRGDHLAKASREFKLHHKHASYMDALSQMTFVLDAIFQLLANQVEHSIE